MILNQHSSKVMVSIFSNDVISTQ